MFGRPFSGRVARGSHVPHDKLAKPATTLQGSPSAYSTPVSNAMSAHQCADNTLTEVHRHGGC